ncbi:MAG: hypothetical protein A2X23_02205 [Chloroflexi bacterium GWC2_73_18]|nr:MAG: hypothetical protein A2X23_02205 [Chloroflexi bacterium GWC2_73_18]
MTDPIEHSAEARPVCGEQRQAVTGFPSIHTTGPQPFGELFGVVEPHDESARRIACLACGAEWRDLEAFRAAREGRPQPGRAGRHRRR